LLFVAAAVVVAGVDAGALVDYRADGRSTIVKLD